MTEFTSLDTYINIYIEINEIIREVEIKEKLVIKALVMGMTYMLIELRSNTDSSNWVGSSSGTGSFLQYLLEEKLPESESDEKEIEE